MIEMQKYTPENYFLLTKMLLSGKLFNKWIKPARNSVNEWVKDKQIHRRVLILKTKHTKNLLTKCLLHGGLFNKLDKPL